MQVRTGGHRGFPATAHHQRETSDAVQERTVVERLAFAFEEMDRHRNVVDIRLAQAA
jgi:hypothetical protein